MKSKKINIQTITIILLIGIIISLIFSNLNLKNNNIKKQEITKEQLGETTTDNSYVEMQSHLSEINKQEEKLLEFKSAIATAITNEGVTTSGTDTETTMASNIASILKTKTSDATAIAEDIAQGKTAYVNGELITGSFTDNTNHMYALCGITFAHSGSTNIKNYLPEGVDYKTLTINNFFFKPTTIGHYPNSYDSGSVSTNFKYNASTGVIYHYGYGGYATCGGTLYVYIP